tara:strand:+ start:19097 stop:20683 length:1587 start_codon:yes stop_codon:yes gene_type:complete
MAIVQISKIQHRRGLKENLPNLGSAELGWSLDTRQLYIGNGAITEGAPTVGRTEILTEHSNILGLVASYTYTGETSTGYSAQTGADIGTPIARRLQDRIDETVSVKSFGAVGDGSADDTVAINRAFNQLFCVESNPQIRRTLYFPAGNYKISDIIKIPTYASMVGDGKDSTTITQTNASAGLVFKLADSLQQVDANIGNNAATRPSYIRVVGITFATNSDSSVGKISAASNIVFNDVKFTGTLVDPSDAGNNTYGIFIESTPVLQCKHIIFTNCSFNGLSYAVIADDDMDHILFDSCEVYQLYRGFKFGENTSGSGASVNGPTGITIKNTLFDDIANTAIYVYTDIEGIHSVNNRFKEVANSYAGASNPSAPVIVFGGDYNFSVLDQFDRPDADELVYARVEFGIKSNYVQYKSEIRMGTLAQRHGGQVQLVDNQAVATGTGIVLDAVVTPMLILDYSLVRDSIYRSGRMLIAHSSAGQAMDDSFTETGALGVVFSLVNGGGSTTEMYYTSTSIGYTGTFTYAIRYLR